MKRTVADGVLGLANELVFKSEPSPRRKSRKKSQPNGLGQRFDRLGRWPVLVARLRALAVRVPDRRPRGVRVAAAQVAGSREAEATSTKSIGYN